MISVLSAYGRKALEIREAKKVFNIYVPEEYWDYIEQFKSSYVNLSKSKRMALLKKEKYSFDKLTYYMEVWEHTEREKHKLDKKDFKNVIDHIIPIIYGYRNKIEAHKIGGLNNIQMLTSSENLRKGSKVTNDALIKFKNSQLP